MALQQYELGACLGEGGMGRVYAATHRALGASVVIKQLTMRDATAEARFEREARLLFSQVRHPVFPTVKDFFRENNQCYLVMDRAPGQTLQAYIDAAPSGQLEETWVLTIAGALLDGLSHLHARGIQHRDIKPDNVMIDARSGGLCVMLVDFGIAHDASPQHAGLTHQSGGQAFTPHYAPLEQVLGQATTPASDLYQLAATLYAATTGCLPPEAQARYPKDSLHGVRALRPGASPGLEAALSRGLALDPAARWQRAEDFADALGVSGQAPAPPPPPITTPPPASTAPATGQASADARQVLTRQRRQLDIRRRT